MIPKTTGGFTLPGERICHGKISFDVSDNDIICIGTKLDAGKGSVKVTLHAYETVVIDV